MFLIIDEDKPIYQLDFTQTEKQVKQYFLIHASLDNIDLLLKNKKDFFLGQIKSDDIIIYAFVNSIQLKLILVLGVKKDVDKNMQKNIKQFFVKVNEFLAVALLNPLYKSKQYIKSSFFDERVKNASKEHLRGIIGQKKK